ncbi:hypothetical protein ACMFMG_004412 [Clarireedia jacksonii]
MKRDTAINDGRDAVMLTRDHPDQNDYTSPLTFSPPRCPMAICAYHPSIFAMESTTMVFTISSHGHSPSVESFMSKTNSQMKQDTDINDGRDHEGTISFRSFKLTNKKIPKEPTRQRGEVQTSTMATT